ncbi:2-amino-4-hydroxy-6-hydroxymethyldihydropteridine diphosphokinase [Nocardiopsis sp. FR4]|uniref:2-amino-4-hydroxy-6- hydroxymethyldihydropteridine diphosphokinase n=1 Tax=Nocardiopsis sp. FR4 TaxID=2605985 RepID=UPI001359AB98|nr:2-amino-4-hydroxy-6-hydroxymethyldihydropteridine diphosphokinase [Nocardiopsis sp. FR4]
MTTSLEPLVIGMGSNIDPAHHVSLALDALHQRASVVDTSSVYRSPAVGLPVGSPDFLNLAVRLRWSGTLFELKALLEDIENGQGRVRDSGSWVSRTLDLDILVAGRLHGQVGSFSLPHPDIERFAHVAVPLAELVGEHIHSRLGVTYSDLATSMDASHMERLEVLPRGTVA